VTVAERNRAIKRVLIGAFPGCKVSVTGDRGTAYGWVNVRIDWTPLDSDQAREMKRLVWQLLDKAGLGKEIGTYGYDDPGSDYGYGNKISIDFNSARYYRTMRMTDGRLAACDRNGEWQTVEGV
jgi:hypothetical protein